MLYNNIEVTSVKFTFLNNSLRSYFNFLLFKFNQSVFVGFI
jgi:hypothetical protein